MLPKIFNGPIWNAQASESLRNAKLFRDCGTIRCAGFLDYSDTGWDMHGALTGRRLDLLRFLAADGELCFFSAGEWLLLTV